MQSTENDSTHERWTHTFLGVSGVRKDTCLQTFHNLTGNSCPWKICVCCSSHPDLLYMRWDFISKCHFSGFESWWQVVAKVFSVKIGVLVTPLYIYNGVNKHREPFSIFILMSEFLMGIKKIHRPLGSVSVTSLLYTTHKSACFCYLWSLHDPVVHVHPCHPWRTSSGYHSGQPEAGETGFNGFFNSYRWMR